MDDLGELLESLQDVVETYDELKLSADAATLEKIELEFGEEMEGLRELIP